MAGLDQAQHKRHPIHHHRNGRPSKHILIRSAQSGVSHEASWQFPGELSTPVPFQLWMRPPTSDPSTVVSFLPPSTVNTVVGVPTRICGVIDD